MKLVPEAKAFPIPPFSWSARLHPLDGTNSSCRCILLPSPARPGPTRPPISSFAPWPPSTCQPSGRQPVLHISDGNYLQSVLSLNDKKWPSKLKPGSPPPLSSPSRSSEAHFIISNVLYKGREGCLTRSFLLLSTNDGSWKSLPWPAFVIDPISMPYRFLSQCLMWVDLSLVPSLFILKCVCGFCSSKLPPPPPCTKICFLNF